MAPSTLRRFVPFTSAKWLLAMMVLVTREVTTAEAPPSYSPLRRVAASPCIEIDDASSTRSPAAASGGHPNAA
jgi:hypothetical protein